MEDTFAPISTPSAEYMRLQPSVKVYFIDTEANINKMTTLIGKRFIGLDAEWRPLIYASHPSIGPAILQIAGGDCVFIIDIIKLSKSQ